MGRPFKTYLNGTKIYSCSNCRCHSADHDDIISKVRYIRILPCSCFRPRSTRFVHAGFPRQAWPGISVQQRVSHIAVLYHAYISRTFLGISTQGGILLQRQRDTGSQRGQTTDDRPTHRCRYILQSLSDGAWLEIRECLADISCQTCSVLFGW